MDSLNAGSAVRECSCTITVTEMAALTENTCSQLPRLPVLYRTIYKCRVQNNAFTANPMYRHRQDHNRILIFASERGLRDIA